VLSPSELSKTLLPNSFRRFPVDRRSSEESPSPPNCENFSFFFFPHWCLRSFLEATAMTSTSFSRLLLPPFLHFRSANFLPTEYPRCHLGDSAPPSEAFGYRQNEMKGFSLTILPFAAVSDVLPQLIFPHFFPVAADTFSALVFLLRDKFLPFSLTEKTFGRVPSLPAPSLPRPATARYFSRLLHSKGSRFRVLPLPIRLHWDQTRSL